MAEPAVFPEQRFLRAILPDELAESCLALLAGPDAETLLSPVRRQIDAVLATLSYRERGILEMRYGLGDGHAYTLAEAGHVFRLTRERIRQIQVRSLKKIHRVDADLRNLLDALGLRDGDMRSSCDSCHGGRGEPLLGRHGSVGRAEV